MPKKKEPEITIPKSLDETSTKEELLRLNASLESYLKYFRTRNVIGRGLIYGLFTAIGATIGFTAFLLIVAWFLQGVSAVPLIDKFLEETRLDVLIENQLDGIQPTPTPVIIRPTFPLSTPIPTVKVTITELKPSVSGEPIETTNQIIKE